MNQSIIKSPKHGVNAVQVRNALRRRFPDVRFSAQRKYCNGGVVMRVTWIGSEVTPVAVQDYAKTGLAMFFDSREAA